MNIVSVPFIHGSTDPLWPRAKKKSYKKANSFSSYSSAILLISLQPFTPQSVTQASLRLCLHKQKRTTSSKLALERVEKETLLPSTLSYFLLIHLSSSITVLWV